MSLLGVCFRTIKTTSIYAGNRCLHVPCHSPAAEPLVFTPAGGNGGQVSRPARPKGEGHEPTAHPRFATVSGEQKSIPGVDAHGLRLAETRVLHDSLRNADGSQEPVGTRVLVVTGKLSPHLQPSLRGDESRDKAEGDDRFNPRRNHIRMKGESGTARRRGNRTNRESTSAIHKPLVTAATRLQQLANCARGTEKTGSGGTECCSPICHASRRKAKPFYKAWVSSASRRFR